MCNFLKYVIIIFMKILFITDLYPIKSDEVSTPVTLHNFVFEWIKQGHQVEVIKPNFLFNSFLRGKPFYKTGFYEFEGVKIFNVNYFTPFLFNIHKKIPDYFKISDYDAIIAHMPSGLIFANKLNNEHKPMVCGVHASDIEILTNPIYSIYFKKELINAYKNAKKIACRSFVLQKKFCQLLPEFADKTFAAPSGMENKNILARVQDAKRSFNHSFFTVLTCANLIKRKNIDKLILAVKDLDDFELKVIGDGNELKKLQYLSRAGLPSCQTCRKEAVCSHCQRKNFFGRLLPEKVECDYYPAKVFFLERLPHEKVLEEMQKADIFVLPSINETFGMVYLEAMASGCITVCTSGDGIDGIIKDEENGFLTEPTIKGIKEVLLKIKSKSFNEIEQIRKNALKTLDEFSPESCAQNYLKQILK